MNLAVEIDGYYHFQDPDAYRRDRRKDLELQKHGYLVVRVLAEDVVCRLEEVLETILAAVAFRRWTDKNRHEETSMTEPSPLSPIESLVLARLLLAGEKGTEADDQERPRAAARASLVGRRADRGAGTDRDQAGVPGLAAYPTGQGQEERRPRSR